MTTAVRFKVEKFSNGEWGEVSGLLNVRKGDRFRIYAFDGITIAKQGTASEDGYLNSEGTGCCNFDYGKHDGDCNNEPLTKEQMKAILEGGVK